MATRSDNFTQASLRGNCLVVTLLEQQMRDFEKVTQIKLEIIAAVQESAAEIVVLDLANVRFVGSVGFLAFLAINREPSVTRIVLCNLDPIVHQLFSVCKLIPEGATTAAPLQVADTVDAAIARFGTQY